MNEEVVLAFKRKKLKKLNHSGAAARAIIETGTGADGRTYRNIAIHTGERFGRLTVIGFSHRKDEKSYYLCRCSCGKVVPVMYSHLLTGNTRSCGCYRRELTIKRNKKNR